MSNSKKSFGAIIVIVLATLLTLVFRVDPWWGREMPIVISFLTVRELYYIAIWGVGYLLVIYTVLKLWKDPKEF